jgi:hypothetical protein
MDETLARQLGGYAPMRFKSTSMEGDVKKHHHHSPGDASVLASGVHPRS